MKIIHLVQTLIISTAAILVIVVFYNEYSADSVSLPTQAYASLPPGDMLLAEETSQQPIENVEPSIGDEKFDTVPFADSRDDDQMVEIIGTIKQGDNLDSSLRRLPLSAQARQQIIASLSNHLDFKRLDAKDMFTVRLDKNGALVSCTYEAGPLDIYSLEVKDGETFVKKDAVQLENKTVRIIGNIDSSLFAAFAGLSESPNIVYAFADIFSSKIDFNTETQKGDTFSLIVDKYYKDDAFIGYGKIEMAQYTMTNGKTIEGYYYVNKDGIGAYFDGEGKEVGTSFLRSPVPMGRVTSKFTYRRKHPITGRIQPHLGVDLAAPVGTPILAASDGKVISIGKNGGNGRQIILSHNGGIKTYYGHLSRYKKGLQEGSFVEKKEVIGYVGSSGLSTGPHLDYRIKKGGVFKNPFSLEFTPKSVLSGPELANFQEKSSNGKQALLSVGEATGNIVEVKNFTLAPDQKLHLL